MSKKRFNGIPIFQIILFVFVMLMILLGMHLYVFYRTITLINGGYSAVKVGLGSLVLSILYVGAMMSREYKLLKWYYIFAQTWLGILFIVFSLHLVGEIIQFFVPAHILGWGILGVGAVLSVYALIHGSTLRVKTITVALDVPKAVTLVQLSDIHLGIIRDHAYLERVVKLTNAQHPDFVVVTGDLFDGGAVLVDDLITSINNVEAPVYYVTGNHEVYEGLTSVFSLLSHIKITHIRNEQITVNGLDLVGVDYVSGKPELGLTLLSSMPKKNPRILLYHLPVHLSVLKKYTVDLHLSGHTHKGQIFPFEFLVRLQFPYTHGLHTDGEHYAYVSPGTGTWGPPMRLGSTSEVTVIKIVPINKG